MPRKTPKDIKRRKKVLSNAGPLTDVNLNINLIYHYINIIISEYTIFHISFEYRCQFAIIQGTYYRCQFA